MNREGAAGEPLGLGYIGVCNMSDKRLEVKQIFCDAAIAAWLLFANYVYFKQYSPNILAALRKIIGILR